MSYTNNVLLINSFFCLIHIQDHVIYFQATEENIRTFTDYLMESQPTGKANFTTAFIQAFNVLSEVKTYMLIIDLATRAKLWVFKKMEEK